MSVGIKDKNLNPFWQYTKIITLCTYCTCLLNISLIAWIKNVYLSITFVYCGLFYAIQQFYFILFFFIISYDVASGSEITPCNTIDKPLVFYRFIGNFMTSITA